MNDAVVSTIRYAQADNEALLNEKAYILNYPTPPEIPKSNFVIDFFPGIKIHNLRTANLSYRENGLAIAKLPTCMPKENFDDEEKIEKIYLPEVHSCIRETLGVEEVYIFDYMIRKREPSFPFQPKTKDNAPQPALSAHIGEPMSLNFVCQCFNRSIKTTRRTKSEADCRNTSKKGQTNLNNDGFRLSSRLTCPSTWIATYQIQVYGNPLPVR